MVVLSQTRRLPFGAITRIAAMAPMPSTMKRIWKTRTEMPLPSFLAGGAFLRLNLEGGGVSGGNMINLKQSFARN